MVANKSKSFLSQEQHAELGYEQQYRKLIHVLSCVTTALCKQWSIKQAPEIIVSE